MGVRLYLSSYGLGNRPELFASMLESDARGFIIMNATDGGDAHRRQQALVAQIEGLAELGLHADGLDLRDWRPDSLEQGLAGAAFFWVHGGRASYAADPHVISYVGSACVWPIAACLRNSATKSAKKSVLGSGKGVSG